jgi:hypothetical protein
VAVPADRATAQAALATRESVAPEVSADPALIDVLELDARGGPKPYVIELRPPLAPAVGAVPEPVRPARSPLDAGEGEPPVHAEGAPVAPPEPTEVAAPGAQFRDDERADLEWPPREADIAAIHVLDLGPHARHPAAARTPASQEPSAPATGSPAHDQSGHVHEPPAQAVVVVRSRHLVVASVVAASLLAALVGLGLWQAWAGRPRDNEATSGTRTPAGLVPKQAGPSKPAATEAARARVEDALRPARAAYAAGDLAGAVRMVAAAIRDGGPDSAGAGLLREWVGLARSQAETARRAAVRSSADAATSPAYAAARRRQLAADAAYQAGSIETAFQGFSDSERAFRQIASGLPGAAPGLTTEAASRTASTTPPLAPAAGRDTATAGNAPGVASASALSGGPAPAPSPLRPEPAPSGVPPPGVTATVPAPGEPAVPASGSPAADTAPTRPAVAEDAGVRLALRAYQGAYGRLDAQAAAAVYPGVDARALARAFEGLRSQSLEFDRCDVNLSGATARAACVGRSTFVPRVGSQSPRVEARRWTFELERRGDDWRITRATVGRP